MGPGAEKLPRDIPGGIPGGIRLHTPLGDLHGIGAARRNQLARLGLRSVADLLRHYPLRYEFEAAEGTIRQLDELPEGAIGSASGTIEAARFVGSPGFHGRGGKGRFEVTLRDDTGTLRLTWFNARYLQDRLRPGHTMRVQGKVKRFNNYPQIVNAKWTLVNENDPTPAVASDRLRPVYPATDGLPSTQIDALLERVLPVVLPQVTDPLPTELVEHHAMPTLAEAFGLIHRPVVADDHRRARRRLAFNELLLLQLGIAVKRAFVQRELKAPALHHSDAIDRHICERFPFSLTEAQRRVIDEIANDLQRGHPMNRLLQGDVGSGKTVVALYAMLMAVADGKQSALMAPTELLAEQHFASISRMLEGTAVRLALVTGNRPEQRDAVARGEVDLIIGTHALLSESTVFHDLAVAVIDEQHRFGVRQRAAMRSGGGDDDHGNGGGGDGEGARSRVPHVLVMTATPIPRTLSLTLFGDLDVSTLDGMPPGRTPVTNRVVDEPQADEVYRYARTRLERGEQVYVVVPAIDGGEGKSGTDEGGPGVGVRKSVNDHAAMLAERFFEGYEVATVHGRLKPGQRQSVMQRFRAGEAQVLVATTVIEVGVDVPNATVMIIEHAERFGLAQLHQLRGRIGRGANQRRPLCVFIAEPTTEDAEKRLEAIASTNDGFKIAELDLQIRGMGEFFGTRQAGAVPLKLAVIPDDLDLLKLAGRDAAALVQRDPTLHDAEHALLRKVLWQQHGESLGLIDVG